MPWVTFQFTLSYTNDTENRYLGMARDIALPREFWSLAGYVIGIVRPSTGDVVVAGPYNIQTGRRFIVFGTNTPAGKGHEFRAKLIGNVNTIETPPIGVNRDVYGYVIYDVASDDRLTLVAYGNVNPGQIPSIQPPPTPQKTLTLRVTTGGAVNLTAGGVTTSYTPGIYNLSFPEGTYITLTANPASGYRLDAWYSDGTKITSSRTTTLTLSTDTTRRAQFVAETPPPPGTYSLTLNIGTGGKLLVNNVEYMGSTTLQFASGTQVTLKAVPDNGYILNEFMIDGTPVSGTQTTITMDGNKSVTVSFVAQQDTLTKDPPFDLERIVRQIMEKMVPPMMGMMMVMSMMQMMVSMMQGLGAGI